ncbi:hypothetical protein AD998_14535 [bacterium 336/3]|nr:hypothetical protein AD998_14535 [bacterium 336/3]
MLQKIKKIAIKTLKILFLTIVGLHLVLRIIGLMPIILFTDKLAGTEFNDERFSHRKWMNIKVGTPKSEVEKSIKGHDLPNYSINHFGDFKSKKDSMATLTSHSTSKENSSFYYSYNFYYDKNQILIIKNYAHISD